MVDQGKRKSYGFLWAEAKTLFQTRQRVWLGICGKSMRVAKLAAYKDVLTPLVVQNVYVDEGKGWCEEERRCIDTDCPLNKTTWESLVRSLGAKKVGKPPLTWGKGNKYNLNEDGSLRDFSEFVKDPYAGGFLLAKAPGSRRSKQHEQ